MQGLGKLKDKKINCIPNNTEKYIPFSIDNLDKLVFNLTKDGSDKFPILKQHIDSDKIPLLLRIGVRET